MTASEDMNADIAHQMLASGRDWRRALLYLTVEDFLNRPDRFDDAMTSLERRLHEHWKPTPIEPDFQHVLERFVIDASIATMGYVLCISLLEHRGRVEFGDAGCYEVRNAFDAESPPEVALYEDTRRDQFMRSVVAITSMMSKLVAHNAQVIRRYEPVWQAEEACRVAMKTREQSTGERFAHIRAPQTSDDIPGTPLDPERTRRTYAQFLRHVMMYLELLSEAVDHAAGQPTSIAELQDAARISTTAVRNAARFPHEIQRRAMGVPLKTRAGKTFGRKGDRPRMVQSESDPRSFEFAGLQRVPPNSTMCAGFDPHVLPPELRSHLRGTVFDRDGLAVSPIELLVEWASLHVAPRSLWVGRLPEPSLKAGLE